MNNKVVISCLLVLLQVSLQKRVVSGIPTAIEELPFLVQVGTHDLFYCYGSLLTQSYVLTAAHCVYDKEPEQLLVMADASKFIYSAMKSTVSNYKLHKDFNIRTLDADVAVLKLTTPIRPLPTAPLPLQPVRPGDKLKNVWEQGSELLTGTIEVLDMDICLRKFPFRKIATHTMFCARELDRSNCVALSAGSPVLRNDEVVGIVVYDIGCSPHLEYTTVYTNVSAVYDFINNAIETL